MKLKKLAKLSRIKLINKINHCKNCKLPKTQCPDCIIVSLGENYNNIVDYYDNLEIPIEKLPTKCLEDVSCVGCETFGEYLKKLKQSIEEIEKCL